MVNHLKGVSILKDNQIHIWGARERNLKNIDISIPKNKIVVFTGVSGSGKSSLVFDTVAAESQRQLNDTYTSFIRHRLPHYGQPNVDRVENLPVSFVINQKRLGGNSRSTVGTITDIYSILRLLYSRIGAPFIGYAETFSFNNAKGMCAGCNGVGYVDDINIDLLLDKQKSLAEGAIRFPTFQPGGWRIRRYIHSGLFDNDKKLIDYTNDELELLLYKDNYKLPHPTPEWPKTSLYEGVIPRIERSFLRGDSEESKRHKKEIDRIVSHKACPECGGSRLNNMVRSCRINGKNIADCSAMQIDELLAFIKTIHIDKVKTVLSSLKQQLGQMVAIGLGYLSLDRETSSLSGGESQRIKMVRQFGSSLCDVMYIFDEPSIGLHPFNVDKINSLFKDLRDKGNTVLIVEHDPDIIKIADYIIDMGPKAGFLGGEVAFSGSFEELKTADTLTAKHLRHSAHFKKEYRPITDWFVVDNAALHNLKNVTVKIPQKSLTVVTGIAGSGKSSLINGSFASKYPQAVAIDQKGVQATKRSNLLTFTGIFDNVRKLFAKQNQADAALFSFNSKGACPVCKGLGLVYTDLAFMDTVATVCDACEGRRYSDEVLAYTVNHKNINDVLNMTVDEALLFFDNTEIIHVLERLKTVGIGYLTLGQSLDTLSGGELQRAKLASELGRSGNIYILDEPTTGLHMSDTEQLLKIFNTLVDGGNTLIVIEHNLDVIVKADWIIDIGPGAGQKGGQVVYSGRPKELLSVERSLTGQYIRQYIKE